jgi:Coenzyme PQQ synthesis protein D (PqqD)
MSEINANTVVQRVELPGSRIQDEMVFFDQEAGKYYATGPVGADIWEFLDAPKSFAAICDHLLGMYEIDHATCELEVRTFLTQMSEAGMISAATP